MYKEANIVVHNGRTSKKEESAEARRKFVQSQNRPKPTLVPSADFINPFIESVNNLFTTMLDCEVRREELSIKYNIEPTLDIVALVGLSGCIYGTVALAFPIKTALAMVSRIYEKEIVVVDSTVIDAVGEFVNVIAGGAQASLSDLNGRSIDLGIPTVIRGAQFSIEYPSIAKWIEIPFMSDLGALLMRITIKTKG